MASSFQEFQDRSTFRLLDGVRALAIIAVIWHHSSGVDPFASEFFGRGYLGVDLFFLLSGFLITHLLIKEKRRTGTIAIKNFYIRRALRIFPLYYTFLAFFGVLTFVKNREAIGDYFDALPYYIFYVSNWAPHDIWHFFHRAWSLAVEEQFYMVWPLLLALLGFIVPARAIVVLCAASLVVFTGFLGNDAINVAQVIVPFRTILIGCLLAIILNNLKGFSLLAPYLIRKWQASMWLLLLLVFVFMQTGPIVGYSQFAVHLLMAFFLGSCILQESNYLAVLLAQRLLVLIGTVSYGIYILHGQLWGVTQKIVAYIPYETLSVSKAAFFVVFMALSLLVAVVSYYCYEAQFLKLKHKYSAKTQPNGLGV